MRDRYHPDDYPSREHRRDLRELLPRDKNDLDAVQRIVEAGYPKVEPIVGDLLKWIRQPDWPVCKPIAAFLVRIGAAVVPHIEEILVRRDGREYIVPLIREVLPSWTTEVLSPLTAFIEQQAIHGQYGTDLPALELLIEKRLVTAQYASDLVMRKRRGHEAQLSLLDSLARLLENDDAV
jgi:hypothetical protein